jgi:hypothetical protein
MTDIDKQKAPEEEKKSLEISQTDITSKEGNFPKDNRRKSTEPINKVVKIIFIKPIEWIKKPVLLFIKRDVMEKTQIVMAIGSIASIIIFIYVSVQQSNQTREALDLAQRNYIEENRPYVFPKTPKAISELDQNVVNLPIVNYGHTPAYRVFAAASFQRLRHVPDPRTNTYNPEMAKMILAPNSEDTLKIPQDKTYWDTNSASRFYVVGKIFYSDNWNNRLHYTTFVYEWIYLHHSFVRHPEYEIADTNEHSRTN